MTDRRERQVSGGFALRLRQVIDAYGSANSIAKAIERSEGAVRKWLRGESEPNVTDLRTLCDQTQTSLEWLVAGRGRREAVYTSPTPAPDNAPLSVTLLESIINAVEGEIGKDDLNLSSTKRSMLIATLYGLSQESQKIDAEAVTRLVRLAR